MRNKKILLILPLVLISLLIALSYNYYFHQSIQKKPKAFCYQTYFGPANPSLMITDLKFADSLISYYSKMEQGENPLFNFPLHEVQYKNPIYILGYAKDSMLVEILSYRNGNFKGSTYDKGYVYYKTLHASPPSTDK